MVMRVSESAKADPVRYALCAPTAGLPTPAHAGHWQTHAGRAVHAVLKLLLIEVHIVKRTIMSRSTTTCLTVRLPNAHLAALQGEAEAKKTTAGGLLREIVAGHLDRQTDDARMEAMERRLITSQVIARDTILAAIHALEAA